MAIRRALERCSGGSTASKPEKIHQPSQKSKRPSAGSLEPYEWPSKFRAKRCVIDGEKLDSQAEGRRYAALKLLERAGEINGLKRQPRFPFEIEGELMFAYFADFLYTLRSTGATVVEDVKGVRTPMFKLKKKIIEKVYGVKIVEVKVKEC